MLLPEQCISAFILAGGQGRRMGGVDKGLVTLAGRPMIAYVIERLRPQIENLAINANRSLSDYRRFGLPVFPDIESGFAGPLMGVLTALRHSQSPWTLVVPCDTPLLPTDLVTRLSAASADTDIVYASDPERSHPVIALIRTELAGDLTAFLDCGERKIDRWYARHRDVGVCFDAPQAFANVNREEDGRTLLPVLERT